MQHTKANKNAITSIVDVNDVGRGYFRITQRFFFGIIKKRSLLVLYNFISFYGWLVLPRVALPHIVV